LKERFFSECFLLSTCNRTELYGIPDTSKKLTTPLAEAVARFLIEQKSASTHVSRKHLYQLTGWRAGSHLFKVVSGIDSMVIGEVQILNQVKTHFQYAVNHSTASFLLNRVLQTAFHVGKRTRSETTISEGAVSVSYAAVELATKIFSSLEEKKCLLVGVGETGELTAKNLVGRGIGGLIIANRTREKAEALAATLGGSVVDFASAEATLKEVDVVITSVGGSEFVLTRDQVRSMMKARANAPLIIIDIGVPRNVDPDVNKLDNVFLHDIDSLSRVVDQNLLRRRAEVPAVNKIIFEELTALHEWYETLQVQPTITDLHRHFETVRSDEVKKHINRFATQDHELLELVTKRIVNKLLHHPTTNLKNGDDESSDDQRRKTHAVRSLFGLHKDVSAGKNPAENKE